MGERRASRMPWVIVILILAAACLLSYLGAAAYHALAGKSSFGEYVSVAGAHSMEVQLAGDGFVYYDGSSLTHMDPAGNVKWTYLVGSGVDFNASAHGVAAWNGRTLTLIDMENGTTTYSADQGTEVSSAKVGSRYAAVLMEADETAKIIVMEKGGRNVYTAELDQLTCVDYGFYSSGTQLWAMALDTTGSVPTCEITTYSPRSMSIVGQISDMEQLMYHVSFQAESVDCTGVTYFKKYDYNGREIEAERELVYGWYLLSSDTGETPIMAFVPTGQTDGTGDIIQDLRIMKGGSDRIVHLPFPCTSIVARGDNVFGFSSDGHVMVANVNSQHVDAYQMPFYIDRVYGITQSGVAVVASGDTLHLLSLGIEE